MAEKRTRPSGSAPEMPPSRNLGVGNSVGNASCGDRHGDDPLALIVSAGARKEKLRQRETHPFRPAKRLPAYAELHAASAFSFLDGSSLPEDLVEEAARLEIPAVALADTNGVYGAPRFYKAAKAAGVKAIVGAEVTLSPSPPSPSPSPAAGGRGFRGMAPRDGPRGFVRPAPRLTLLVESRAGYRNLCRLITAGALGKPKGETSVTLAQVAAHAEGLHVLTG